MAFHLELGRSKPKEVKAQEIPLGIIGIQSAIKESLLKAPKPVVTYQSRRNVAYEGTGPMGRILLVSRSLDNMGELRHYSLTYPSTAGESDTPLHGRSTLRINATPTSSFTSDDGNTFDAELPNDEESAQIADALRNTQLSLYGADRKPADIVQLVPRPTTDEVIVFGEQSA